MWYLYILLTQNNKLYTGITTNLERRYDEHCSGIKGAKFTRANPPKELVHVEFFDDRSEASKRECEIKKMSRKQKDSLCKSN
jgi:putative endonuclease